MAGTTGSLDAARALATEHFGLSPVRVRQLSESDTAVYRVDTESDSYVMRRHGTHSDAEIIALMGWLEQLRDADIRGPLPQRARDGRFVVDACTLVTWVPGRRQAIRPRLVHFERLGELMARMHRQVLSVAVPPARPQWSAKEIFCERGIGMPPSGDVWGLVPQKYVEVLRRATAVAGPIVDRAERHLIHADLHLFNVVFADGRACPIDFDDAGIGAWNYDVASALSHHRFAAEWPDRYTAFCRGYELVRPLPDPTDLDVFFVARIAGLALWVCAMSETIPRFRAPLPRWLDHYASQLRMLMN